MAITTLDGYIGAAKQKIQYTKTVARTTVAGFWFSLIDIAGQPGAGTLAAGNTTAGIVPTDATGGHPLINAYGASAKGYLSIVQFFNTLAGRLQLFDRLWHAGAISFAAATTTISAPPSFSSRVPSGTDFTGIEIWIEVVTAFLTGTAWNVSVSYTNALGVSGRTATLPAALAAANLTLGRLHQMNLQAGDSGVQSIQSIVVTNAATAMTAGTFNVLISRPLWNGRVNAINDGDNHDLAKTGLPEVWTDSALEIMVNMDSTSSGIPDLLIEIANG